MSKRPGLNDPDRWHERWQGLHPSVFIAGDLARLAVDRLESPDFEEGTGSATLRTTEEGAEIEVEVQYVLEQFPDGRIMHVLSILSPGDPLPPIVDEP